MRGSNNLIFTNSRTLAEQYSDKLASKCKTENLPVEFYPHHGNLAKEHREVVESLIKNPKLPTTLLCTTTLEMGIDIGSIKSVAQLDCPPSVASLKQRLGRSGRRGEKSILRLYSKSTQIKPQTNITQQIRSNLFQSVAMIELMLEGWVEPYNFSKFNLSVLIHQIISIIAQYGGISAGGLKKY